MNNFSLDSAISLVDKALKTAAESLRYSFEAYWSTYGNTGAHERNLSLHIASGFLMEQLAVFGEGHSEGSAKMRYDLIVYSKSPSCFVVAEVKQLWTASKAKEMKDDIKRLLEFRPVKRKLEPSSSTMILGLIAAFCEEDMRFHQLTTRNEFGKCIQTNDLIKITPHNSCWKNHKISNHGWHPDKPKPLHLIYSVFKISENYNNYD